MFKQDVDQETKDALVAYLTEKNNPYRQKIEFYSQLKSGWRTLFVGSFLLAFLAPAAPRFIVDQLHVVPPSNPDIFGWILCGILAATSVVSDIRNDMLTQDIDRVTLEREVHDLKEKMKDLEQQISSKK